MNMDHYYSLSEKRSYIDADFMESKLYKMGLLPEGRDERIAYFRQALAYGYEFLNRYASKGWSTEYAREIIDDWFSNLDKLMREKSHETNTRAS